MTLTARTKTVHTENGDEQHLVVACPQRVDPVSITECARCELCEGLELDGHVGVRCAVEPPDAHEGSPPAYGPVTAIMTSPVVSVERDAAIENVQWLLLERGIGAVPVVDSHRRPIGIVAKTDLLRDRDEPMLSVDLSTRETRCQSDSSVRETSGLCAGDVMTPVVRAVLGTTSIAAVAALMARERIHHIVVVTRAGELAGIVSTFDLARWAAAHERFAPIEAGLPR